MEKIELRVISSIDEIPRESWSSLLRPDDNPFLSWDFLATLEETGCVAPERGWHSCHLTAWDERGLLAAAPAYAKTDGMGDFSRDWGLYDLLQRLGGQLYPKLVVGIPFSPVSGRRILIRDGASLDACCSMLMQLAQEIARHNEFESVQVLYHHRQERDALAAAGLAPRSLVQYHWRNHDYRAADDWLARLKSKQRYNARRERREPERQGIVIRTVRNGELAEDPTAWADRAYSLYRTTCEKYMWGGAYLNRECYRLLFERLGQHFELVTAELDGTLIAGAINLATDTHLFGRYWGCFEEHRFLHFNVCLYHSIDECIARGLQVFEGGAGGEHKLSRGFEPTLVYCAQWFARPEVDQVVRRALVADSMAREHQIESWRQQQGYDPPGATARDW